MPSPILTLKNISKYYISGSSVVAGLLDVTLSFERGEFVAVTGESGSGKSTLAHVLGGIIPYENGEMLYSGAPTSHFDSSDWEKYRRDSVSFISQSYGILLGNTVMENIICALRLSGMRNKNAEAEADSILHRVDLWELRDRRAAKLSSGQKQRLSIARALAKSSPILIADEPTGNLDAENSEKIIRLLADASRDRLVILITHEYSEAEAYVTRRITIRDGRIQTDEAVKPSPHSDAGKVTKDTSSHRESRRLSGYISRLQLRARPVFCIFMLLFFMLTAFSVFAFIGTFIVAIDDTDTRIYDNSAFRNGDMRRIAVMKPGGESFNEADYDSILALDYVESLQKYGKVCDFACAYRRDIDYETVYSVNYDIFNSNASTQRESLKFTDTEPFIQTIPMLDDRDFLTSGRLPENIYEVVSADEGFEIGDTFTVYIQDRKNWSTINYISFDVTVTGVTDYGEGLYFHEDMGASAERSLAGEAILFLPTYEDYLKNKIFISPHVKFNVYIPTDFIVIRDFNDPEKILLTCGIYFDDIIMRDNQFCLVPIRLDRISRDLLPDADDSYNGGVMTYNRDKFFIPEVMGFSASTLDRVCVVGNEYYELSLKNYRDTDQISVTVTDYAYSERVITSLEKLGYVAVSPFVLGSTKQNPDLADARMQTLKVCLIASIAVILLQVVVLRAMFGLEIGNYGLLANIGLSKETAEKSIFRQIVIFTVSGQLLALASIIACNMLGVARIVNVAKYLPLSYALLLSLIHLVSSLLSALWIKHSIARRIYPGSSVPSDLDFDN